MKYKLIASDMDGTLLNSKSVLSEENRLAVISAVKHGIYFVLSTGRPLQAIEKFTTAMELQNMPIIAYNGAMVVFGGEIIYNLTLSQQAVRQIADEGHKRNSTLICWAENRLYAEHDGDKIRRYQKISDVEPIFVSDIGSLENVTKIVWYDTPKETEQNYEIMSKLFGGEVNVHPTRIDFLEFVNKDCSKAIALKIIGEKLDILPEEMIALGDGFNDLPMLEYAGLGVAMKNAPQAVKVRTKLTTDSCDENGVKTIIDRFVINGKCN